MSDTTLPFTQTQLMENLKTLGLHAGQTIMLHASVNAVGDVMGGPNAILQAVLDVLTPSGTLMMYAGWQDIPDFLHELPEDVRQAYYEHHPAFDPTTSRSVRDNSILVEFFRTWPGTQRSLNPEASIVALGAQATYITQDHPLNYGYGAGSPLEKLVSLQGSVVMLGAPLDTITLLHYAEWAAKLRHKNVIHYQCPILQEGKKVWIDIEDYNTGDHHDDYTFEEIAHAYIAQGKHAHGSVGDADTYVFNAADLNEFAVQWLETRFGA